jgi:hypothetical protein
MLEKRGNRTHDDAVVSVQQVTQHPNLRQGISWTAACCGGKDGDGVWVGLISEANLEKARCGIVYSDLDRSSEDDEPEPLSVPTDFMDFAIQLTDDPIWEDGEFEVTPWEDGMFVSDSGGACKDKDNFQFKYGDTFAVTLMDNAVLFQKNGKTIYASKKAPAFPLHAFACLYSPGAKVAGVQLQMARNDE